jgi:geranylgeranyl pyrophosphate synthase
MADPDAEDAFARFGRAFGMLYQVVDDYVGVWGDSEATGKSELGDVVLRKASLPMLYGYQRGSEDLRSRLRQATGSAPPSVEEAVRIRDELTRLGVRELCRQHAVRYRDEAVASLRATRCERPEIGMLETMAVLCAEMSAERG